MYLLILAMLPTPKNEARMKNTCSVVKERPLRNCTFITINRKPYGCQIKLKKTHTKFTFQQIHVK